MSCTQKLIDFEAQPAGRRRQWTLPGGLLVVSLAADLCDLCQGLMWIGPRCMTALSWLVSLLPAVPREVEVTIDLRGVMAILLTAAAVPAMAAIEKLLTRQLAPQ